MIEHPLISNKYQRRVIDCCCDRRMNFNVDGSELMFYYDKGFRGKVLSVHDKREYVDLPEDEPAVITRASYTVSQVKKLYRARLMLRCVTPSGYAMRMMILNPKIAQLRSVAQLNRRIVRKVRPTLTVFNQASSNADDMLVIEQAQIVERYTGEHPFIRLSNDKRMALDALPDLRSRVTIWSQPDIYMMLSPESDAKRMQLSESRDCQMINPLDFLVLRE